MLKKRKESEKKTERYLTEQIKSLGGLCIKLVPQYFSGLPDRLCLLPGGILFFIETKSQGDNPRLLQTVVHKNLRSIGFDVYVCSTKAEIDSVLFRYGLQ